VWFPIQFRPRTGLKSLRGLRTLLIITETANQNNIPLDSLWRPGGALYRALNQTTHTLLSKQSRVALEFLQQDLLPRQLDALQSASGAPDNQPANDSGQNDTASTMDDGNTNTENPTNNQDTNTENPTDEVNRFAIDYILNPDEPAAE
jgi:hypothetical protein